MINARSPARGVRKRFGLVPEPGRRERLVDLGSFHALDIVVICGLPASGKSHFAQKFFKESGRKRVNRKEIRRLLYEMTTFGAAWSESKFAAVDEFLVKHVERKIIEHLLENKQKVLVDNTSVSVSSREVYASIASKLNKTVGVIFLNTPAQKCLERNRTRPDPIPETVISNLAAALELPTTREALKEVLVVRDA
jgi:tRNA uridine 5-carbamoylmethylation protein Kti12